MGLDIYAGSMTRYYAQNWKTVTQQWAEQNGMQYSRITPNADGSGEKGPDVAEIQQDMVFWMDNLLQAMASSIGPADRTWVEDNVSPYYTDKPDWDAYGALLLYGACRKYRLDVPQTVEKGWDFNRHEILQHAFADENLNWSLYRGTAWWLPIEEMMIFQYQTPNGVDMAFGTTGALLEELRCINEMGWNAQEAEILGWQHSEGYPADMEMVDGQYKRIADNTQYNTQSLAKYAYSLLYQAARFSRDNRVPIILDY